MIAVGRPAAEAELGLIDASTCSGSQSCFQVSSPTRAMVGTNAGTFSGDMFCKTACGAVPCRVFLFKDATGWHYVNARCPRNVGVIPGPSAEVYVSSCAYVRKAPALAAPSVACLKAGASMDVDSAPVYADGHIWWHLVCRGWVAHDFLVAPLHGPYVAPISIPLLPPFTPSVTVTPDHGQANELVRFVGRCFPSNEYIGVYVETSSSRAFIGTPGPVSDENGTGQFEFTIPVNFAGPVRVCGDTGYPNNNNQYAAKACATLTIGAGPNVSTPSPSPAPSSTPQPSLPAHTDAAPSASPVLTVMTAKRDSFPVRQLVVGIVVVIIAGAGAILAYRRRSRR